MEAVFIEKSQEGRKIKGGISIKPFINKVPNMGLEKYDQALFDGAIQRDSVFCNIQNNIKRYLTGLDETAKSVQELPKEEKEAAINEIRKTIVFLENNIGSNWDISEKDIDDQKFYTKVQMFKSYGPDTFDQQGHRVKTYWDSIIIDLDNAGKLLDLTNPHDLIHYHIAKAGGFSLVAPSLQYAIDNPGYNFYLDTIEDTAAIKTKLKKLRNRAGALLETMIAKDHIKLFYVAKVIAVGSSMQYRKGGSQSTPIDVLYDDCCKYIDGETVERNVKVCVDKFLEACDRKIDDLALRAIVKDATALRLISIKGDGHLYYIKTNVNMGKTVSDVVAFLLNPLNEDLYKDLKGIIEKEWVK